MKTKQLGFLSIVMIALIGFSCTSTTKSEESSDEVAESADDGFEPITLTKAPPSPEFPDAQLSKIGIITTPTDTGNHISYSFEVANYELGAQTEDAATRGIANSGKGQHIHYIVNNGPYAAHYMDGINDVLEDGNYVVLAFLSRSYHESVKSEGAFYIENLAVGPVDPEEADLSAQHLFYSRPKGTYKGADTEKVMLDFYLLNTELSSDGNKVIATINGKEFTIDEWAPYYIEGLMSGETTIELELVDADGNTIPGPFNKVKRTITIEE